MTHIPENARQADEPIEVRRQADIARQREIADGLMRRHVAIAEDARIDAEISFARTIQHGRAIGAALRKL